MFVDHGLTGRNRERPVLREALAAVRERERLVYVGPDGDEMVLRVLARAHLEAALATRYLAEGGQVAAGRLVVAHRKVIAAQEKRAQRGKSAARSCSQEGAALEAAHRLCRTRPRRRQG